MPLISEIEGIGPVLATKLSQAGIATTDQLLREGASPQGRNALASATGITATRILGWVNHCDLSRVKGIGWEYADLLEAAGVDSVAELARRNVGNLHASLVKVNDEKELVRRLPSETQLSSWIEDAKSLPKVVTH